MPENPSAPVQQEFPSFNELRARFDAASNGVVSEREAHKEEELNNNTNVVAARKRLFEQRQRTSSDTNGTAPIVAARPKIPQKPMLKLPTTNAADLCPEPEQNLLPTNCDGAEHQTEGMRSVIERLNKIGHRPFDRKSFDRLSGMQQQKRVEQLCGEREQHEPAEEMAQEANTDYSSGSEPEVLEYSDDGASDCGGTVTSGSRRQSSCFAKEDTILASIVNEMRTKGLFKKCSIHAELPSELGRVRPFVGGAKKSARKACASDPPPEHHSLHRPMGLNKAHTADLGDDNSESNGQHLFLRAPHWQAGEQAPKTASMVSSHSGSTMDGDECASASFEVPQYETGDEKEDKRLRELHSVALEFLRMQRSYVQMLQHIGENYPRYLAECETRLNKRWQIAEPQHVVKRIEGHFRQITGVHKMFLGEFAAKLAKWDSRRPDLAEVLHGKADFLKICSNFLKVKRTLAQEFQHVLDTNPDLADATRRFEQGVLNEGSSSSSLSISSAASQASQCGTLMSLRGINIVMQLDAVHQNVVRYRLLMERYRKHLPDTLLEASIADEALKKLTAVSNTVNEFLSDADAGAKLLELHRKLYGLFDVFAPGRKLLYEGELRRQTRKELQLRYLILFSDTLLICRYGSSLSADFHADSMYKIPIGKVRIEVEDHDDYELEFVVCSPKKSSAFVAKSKRERDVWVQRIEEARRVARANARHKKRRSMGAEQQQQNYGLQNGDGAEQAEQQQQRLSNATLNSANSQFYCRRSLAEMAQQTQHQSSAEESPSVEQRPFPLGEASGAGQPSVDGNDPITDLCASLSAAPSLSPFFRHSFNFLPKFKPRWVPDNKCLMAGCSTRFSVIRRKHHCRQCGWLICSRCVGYAPVNHDHFERDKVCPECYFLLQDAFEQGVLFPPAMVRNVCADASQAAVALGHAAFGADGAMLHSHSAAAPASPSEERKFRLEDPFLRISYDNGARLVPPGDLFQPPFNGRLSKAKIPVKGQDKGPERIFSGKVYLRCRKGTTVPRWASLTREYFIQFYEAEYDDQPSESHFIYGYAVKHSESEEAGTCIELTHRNQFQTERKEDQIAFLVLHSGSAQKWIDALQSLLMIEQPLEEAEDEEETANR